MIELLVNAIISFIPALEIHFQLGIYFGILFTILVPLLTVIKSQSKDISNIKQKIDAIKMSLTNRKNSESTILKVAEKYILLDQFDSAMKKTGHHLLDETSEWTQVNLVKKSISVHGREISYKGYNFFWNELCKDKAIFADRKPIAKITHASVIDGLFEEGEIIAKRPQKEFAKKGTILRILIGSNTYQEDIMQKYVKAMEQMVKDRISCVYINSEDILGSEAKESHGGRGGNVLPGHDFCLVNIGSYTLEWILNNRRVDKIQLSNSEERYNETLASWVNLVYSINSVDYSKDANTNNHLKFLKRCKDDFIKKNSEADNDDSSI